MKNSGIAPKMTILGFFVTVHTLNSKVRFPLPITGCSGHMWQRGCQIRFCLPIPSLLGLFYGIVRLGKSPVSARPLAQAAGRGRNLSPELLQYGDYSICIRVRFFSVVVINLSSFDGRGYE